MTHTPSRPAPFSPAAGQRRWVRDQRAAIWNPRAGRWIHFVRVERVESHMVEAPYDHNDVGRWERQTVSVWQNPCTGAQFASLRDAAAWVEAMPG